MLTTIHGTLDKNKIGDAVKHYIAGHLSFINPDILNKSNKKYFLELSELNAVFKRRIESVIPQLTDILWSINNRAGVIKSREYLELSAREQESWSKSETVDFEVGIRACVDAGLTREAVAGTGAHLGRSLAGDDDLIFVSELNEFRLMESVMKKKLIHAGRGGRKEFLEILIEHTGCGRRAQMIANLDANSGVTHNFDLVFKHIACLIKNDSNAKLVDKIWPEKMSGDGGAWAGMWIKIAQKQAYQAIQETSLIMPIMLYDKMNGNVWVGLDNEEVLFDPMVIENGGLTQETLSALVKEGKIWSLKNEINEWDKTLSKLTVKKGKYTFADLQNNWLEVKKSFIQVSTEMWQYSEEFKSSIDRYLKLSKMEDAGDCIKRRYIHQLFRMFAYVWVLDTFERGNAPGKHMEDHLASGESAVLGVKEHLPLGQGGLQVPTATEFFTGRSVLLHSTPGKEGKPIVVLMKHDTSEVDENPLSGEETQRAMDDFTELLKLWPYIVVGDMVPVVVVRNKQYMGISRLALSIVLAFGDIVHMAANERVRLGDRDISYGSLAEIVPASNSKGEVMLVPASEILRVGIEAHDNLFEFRKLVTVVADNYSDEIVQAALRSVVS